MAKQEEAGIDFNPSKVIQTLLYDFNWNVRKTLAELLPQLKVDRSAILNELLQDEERQVVESTGMAVAEHILQGNHDWLPKYLKLINDKVLPDSQIIPYLPKVFKQTNTFEENSGIVLQVL